jgi:hypothetical protein
MTQYRIVARHVRYWRGQVHRWSTVYPLSGSISAGSYAGVIAALKTMEQAVNFKNTTGAVSGGLYEIALYDHLTGGVPVAVATYFPYATPGSWIPYTGTGWTSSGPLLETAEAALDVRWAAGLSSSGKPVYFRKWYHAVLDSQAVAGGVQVGTTDVASLTTVLTTGIAAMSALGGTLGNSSRLAATTPIIDVYYGNHQMPRGRRRKALVSAGGRVSFPASLLVVPGSDGSLG